MIKAYIKKQKTNITNLISYTIIIILFLLASLIIYIKF